MTSLCFNELDSEEGDSRVPNSNSIEGLKVVDKV